MNPDRRPLAVFLMGPTASGKTALACRLAERLAVELISVDSALVYRDMDIGTAKPDALTRTRFPHRLIDIRDPVETYSAADFRVDALQAMQVAFKHRRLPLLVGGTGLYFRALQQGLSPLPEADAEVRRRLADEAAQRGWPALHARLARLDPVAAERIRPGDSQRIQRALEVIELGGGRPLTEQQRRVERSPFPFRVLKLALVPADRARLHARIATRFDAMLDAGFLDEMRQLRRRGDLTPGMPSMRAVGYRQAWKHLDGTTDAKTFRQHALAATRQLAKRQITWLRGELDARWLDAESPDVGNQAMRAVDRFTQSSQTGICV